MASATVSPDGRWLFTVSQSGVAKLWDAQTGEFVKQVSEVMGPGPSFTHDGRWLISAGIRGYVIDTDTWEPVRPVNAIAVACAPDSRLMAELVEGGVRLVELTTGKEIAFLE